MIHVTVPHMPENADPYVAPSPAASSESHALRFAWAETLRQWRLPASNQASGATRAEAMTSAARARLSDVPVALQSDVRRVLAGLTDALSKALGSFKTVWPATAIRLVTLEDQSVLLEWILVDRRFGVMMTTEQGESGWFFVFSAGSSERYEAGTMDQLDLARLVRMMLI
jgi:hypothetical protein